MDTYDGAEQQEEATINPDKLSDEVTGLMKQKLQAEKWQPRKVDQWQKDLIESTLKVLAEMKKMYKYVVTCVIMQRTGAGLTMAYSTNWDVNDGVFSFDFDNEHLQCAISVTWVKID